MVQSLSGKSVEDRQAIIVTGVTTDQLLGVPAIPNGSAEEVAKVVVSQVKEWKIDDKVKAMSFDTTNVNTGKVR